MAPITTQRAKGTNTAAEAAVALAVSGYGGVAFQLTGTWSGTQTFEGSVDGQNFHAMTVTPIGSSVTATTATTNGVWLACCSGLQAVRVRCSSFSSGVASVAMIAVPITGQSANGTGSGSTAVTIADGADVAEGSTTDAAVTTDSNGTVIAFMRGLVLLEQRLDLDTGAGTALTGGSYLALPASGGPVAGGTATNPIAVTGPLTDTQLRATAVPISAISLPLPTGAALEAGHLATIDTSTAASAAVEGTTGGAAVTTDAAGTIQQYLRGFIKGLAAGTWSVILGAGSAVIGHVIVDSGSVTANAGTNLNTSALATEAGHLATIDTSTAAAAAVAGTTAGAAVITDGNGTLQQYLRGVVKLAITVGGWLVTATGDVASGGTDAGNPVKVGGQVLVANPTALVTGKRSNLITDEYGRQMVRTGNQAYAGNVWTQIHVPNSNTQATKSQGAGAGTIRNVCTGLTVTLCCGVTAPAAIQLSVALIDGSSGGTTYLWRSNISLPAIAGAITAFTKSDLWLLGTAATAMTLEFSAAAGANTFESVSMVGTTVEE